MLPGGSAHVAKAWAAAVLSQFGEWSDFCAQNGAVLGRICASRDLGSPRDAILFPVPCFFCGLVSDSAWEHLTNHTFLPGVARRVSSSASRSEVVLITRGLATDPATLNSWWDADRGFALWYHLPWQHRELLLAAYYENVVDKCDQLQSGIFGAMDFVWLAFLRTYPAVEEMLKTTRAIAKALFQMHQEAQGNVAPWATALSERLWQTYLPDLQVALRLRGRLGSWMKQFPLIPWSYWGVPGFNLSTVLFEHARSLRHALTSPEIPSGSKPESDALGLLQRSHRVAVEGHLFVNSLIGISALSGQGCMLDVSFDRDAGCCERSDVILTLLGRLARGAGGRTLHAVEVGVGMGGTSQRVMAEFRGGLFYTGVDLNDSPNMCHPTSSHGHISYVGAPVDDCQALPRMVYAEATASGARFLEMASLSAATHFENNSLDLVFIDADHGDAVSLDFDAWEPKLRQGGILSGHDFGVGYDAVRRHVVERRCTSVSRSLSLGTDSVFWWYKE